MIVTDYSIYEGSGSCKGCRQPLTPVEVLWGRNGLCGDCRQVEMQNLITSGMVDGSRQ